MSLLRPYTDTVHKVSIVPRGLGALGYTLQLPSEERYLLTEDELLSRVDVLLAGRAAEELVFGNISTGAADDINRATDIVRRMLTEYGMSKNFRHVSLPFRKETRFLGEQLSPASREYSEDTQNYLDREISRIIRQRYDETLQTLKKDRAALEQIAEELLKKEVLERIELERLAGNNSEKAMS
jgi:cell division protease FtsH